MKEVVLFIGLFEGDDKNKLKSERDALK